MNIFVDENAFNMLKKTIEIAEPLNIPVIIYCNPSQGIEHPYVEKHYVENRKDAADFAIANRCTYKDIAITNDSGLAAMILSKKGHCMNTHGVFYSKQNIDHYLSSRHLFSKARRQAKHIEYVHKDIRNDHSTTPRRSYNFEKALPRLISLAEKDIRKIENDHEDQKFKKAS